MLRASNLRCDHLNDPFGIEDCTPLLTWALSPARQHGMQTACQVLAASEPSRLEPDRADYRDSGPVATARCQLRYAGTVLSSRAQCWCMVRVWDDQGGLGPYAPPA